jgi:hypothetical protein
MQTPEGFFSPLFYLPNVLFDIVFEDFYCCYHIDLHGYCQENRSQTKDLFKQPLRKDQDLSKGPRSRRDSALRLCICAIHALPKAQGTVPTVGSVALSD